MRLCERFGWTLDYVRHMPEEDFQMMLALIAAESEGRRVNGLRDDFYRK